MTPYNKQIAQYESIHQYETIEYLRAECHTSVKLQAEESKGSKTCLIHSIFIHLRFGWREKEGREERIMPLLAIGQITNESAIMI